MRLRPAAVRVRVAGHDRAVVGVAAGRARGHGRHPAARRRRRSTSGSTRSTAARPVTSSAPAAPRTVIGEGTIRFTHRAHDSVTGHLDRLGRPLRPDRLRRPRQHDDPAHGQLAQGPGQRPADRRRPRRLARAHRVAHRRRPELDDRQLGRRQRHRRPPARHRRGRRRRQPHASATTPSASTTPFRVDTTITPVGWQNGAVDVPVTATDADSGVDRVEWQIDAQPPGSGLEGTVVRIGTHGIHNFRTRVVDEVGNPSVWIDHTRHGQHRRARPTRPSSRAAGSPTRRSTSTSPPTPTAPPASSASSGGSTASPPATSSGTDTTPVTVTGDGVHELEVRITDDWGRVNDWHTHQVKIDTVNPVDNTTVAAGWLPLTYLDVLVRGTDQHSQVQGVEWRLDGGDVLSASANNHEVRVAGNGVHTLETRIVDNAGRRSAWKVHTIKLDSTLPTNTTPAAPDGLAQHALLGRARRLRRRLRRGLGAAGTIHLEGEPEGDEQEGTRNVARAEIDDDGAHIAQHPHPRRRRQLLGLARRDRSASTACSRPTPRSIRRRPSATATSSPSTRRTTARASPAIEWKLDDGIVKTTATATITGAGAHTLSRPRARQRRQLERLGRPLDHRRPRPRHHRADRHDRDPDAVAARRLQGDRHRRPTTSTAPASTTSSGATAASPTGQGPNGSQFTITDDGEHEIETRAVDKAGNATPWKPPDAAPGHDPADRDDRRSPSGWTNAQHVHAAGHRRHVGHRQPRVQDRQRRADRRRQRHHRHAPGRRRLPHQPPRARQRRPVLGLEGRRVHARHRGARSTRAPPPRRPGRRPRWRWR